VPQKEDPWLHLAKKLVLEKGKVTTPVFTEPIQLILRVSEVLGSYKKNKRSKEKKGRLGEWERGR